MSTHRSPARVALVLCGLIAALALWPDPAPEGGAGGEVAPRTTSGAAPSLSSSPGAAPPLSQNSQELPERSPSPPGVGLSAVDPQRPYIPGEVMVVLREGADGAALASRHGARLTFEGDMSHVAVLQLPGDEAVAGLIEELRQDPDVASAGRHAWVEGATWDLHGFQWYLDGLEIPWGGSSTYSAVAVLDTGVQYGLGVMDQWHGETCGWWGLGMPEPTVFSGVDPWYWSHDLVYGDVYGYDLHQHGTHIASLIAGDGRVKGVSPGTPIMPIRVLNEDKRGTEAWLIEGLYLAWSWGTPVINLSLSFQQGYYPSPSLVEALDLVTQDAVVVAAAGNDGLPRVSWPAAHPEVISVGSSCLSSSTWWWSRAPYSNYGAALDVLAPGGCLDRDIWGDGYVDGLLGESIDLQDPWSTSMWLMAGTSQSAAIVSGVAAQMIEAGAWPSAVRGQLQSRVAWFESSSPYLGGNGAGSLYDVNQSVGAISNAEYDWYNTQPVYVSMVPYLKSTSSGMVAPAARLRAYDANLTPLDDAILVGSFVGKTNSAFTCQITTASPTCEVVGTSAATSGKPAWQVQVGTVARWSWLSSRPRPVMWVNDDLERVYRAVDNMVAGEFLLGWHMAAGSSGLGTLAEAYVFTNGGSGIATSPMGVIATPGAIQQIGTIASTTRNISLTNSSGTGISTSPFGIWTVDLTNSSTTLVAVNGTGISTSPFGIATTLGQPTNCSVCTVNNSMVDLRDGEVINGVSIPLTWSMANALFSQGYVDGTGYDAAAIAGQSVAVSAVSVGSSAGTRAFVE